jgi:hypothetical protein
MNLAFQMEIQTNADGAREIVSVECEPTQEEPAGGLAAEVLAPGSWLFAFVLPDELDDGDQVFQQFQRYGIEPDTAYEACREAKLATVA